MKLKEILQESAWSTFHNAFGDIKLAEGNNSIILRCYSDSGKKKDATGKYDSIIISYKTLKELIPIFIDLTKWKPKPGKEKNSHSWMPDFFSYTPSTDDMDSKI